MRIDDPNTVTTETPAEPVDAAAEVMAEMEKGIAEASEPAPEPVVEAPIEAEAEPPVPGSPEALAAEQAAADVAAAAKAEADAEAAKTPDPEIEKEIAAIEKENGKPMSEGGKNRFREMAGEIKALAPLKEFKAALETAGIKDIADIPKLVANAKDGEDMVAMVSGTGATPDQFGMTLDYLTLVSKAGQGDRASAEQAFELVGKEYLELAKALGKEVQGIFDPLAEYPDLQEEVEAGMSRKHALELAEQRGAKKLQDTAREQANARTQQEVANTTAQQQAITTARADLNALEQELTAADPLYAQKRAALVEKLPAICKEFPPSQWKAAAKLAYQAIQLTPAPAAKVPVGPIRPGGPRPVIVPAVFDDPDAAMEAGIAAASL